MEELWCDDCHQFHKCVSSQWNMWRLHCHVLTGRGALGISTGWNVPCMVEVKGWDMDGMATRPGSSLSNKFIASASVPGHNWFVMKSTMFMLLYFFIKLYLLTSGNCFSCYWQIYMANNDGKWILQTKWLFSWSVHFNNLPSYFPFVSPPNHCTISSWRWWFVWVK